jgi:hypothetical protein
MSYVISLITLGISINRLRSYSKHYQLKENRHTLFFGFISLRIFIIIYTLSVLAFIFLSFIYISLFNL